MLWFIMFEYPLLFVNSILEIKDQFGEKMILHWFELFVGESFQDYSWIQDFEADFP